MPQPEQGNQANEICSVATVSAKVARLRRLSAVMGLDTLFLFLKMKGVREVVDRCSGFYD
jgi:hypothetical protein